MLVASGNRSIHLHVIYIHMCSPRLWAIVHWFVLDRLHRACDMCACRRSTPEVRAARANQQPATLEVVALPANASMRRTRYTSSHQFRMRSSAAAGAWWWRCCCRRQDRVLKSVRWCQLCTRTLVNARAYILCIWNLVTADWLTIRVASMFSQSALGRSSGSPAPLSPFSIYRSHGDPRSPGGWEQRETMKQLQYTYTCAPTCICSHPYEHANMHLPDTYTRIPKYAYAHWFIHPVQIVFSEHTETVISNFIFVACWPLRTHTYTRHVTS